MKYRERAMAAHAPPDARRPRGLDLRACRLTSVVVRGGFVALLLLAGANPTSAQDHGRPTAGAAISAPAGVEQTVQGNLRYDDLERAVWLIEDMATFFGNIAESETNSHAQASWRVLRDNYLAIGQKLGELLANEHMKIAELPPGVEATGRGEMVVVDGRLDGFWNPQQIDQARQIGADDWNYISRLASALIGVHNSFQSLDDWQWFQDQLRRSGAFHQDSFEISPANAREIVQFGFLKDKFLQAAMLAESADTPELRARWLARRNMIAEEAEEFLLKHAAAFGKDPALALARGWREYEESARQVGAGTSMGRISVATPMAAADDSGTDRTENTANEHLTHLDPDLEAALVTDMPERLKVAPPAEPIGVVETSKVAPAAGPMPDDQRSEKWRDDLGQRDYRTVGVTVPIVSEVPGDRLLSTASEDPSEPVALASQQDAAASASASQAKSRPTAQVQSGTEELSAESKPLTWLTQVVSRNATAFALLPFALLLALILFAIVSLWVSARRRRAAEEPIILSVAIDDDAPDLALDEEVLSTPRTESATVDDGATASAVDRLIADLNAAERRAWAETKRAEAASLSALQPAAVTPAAAQRAQISELLPLRRGDVADDEPSLRDLITNLRAGNKQGFERLFQRFTGLERGEVSSLLSRDKEAQLAIACRALAMDDLLFASTFILIRRHYCREAEVVPGRLSHAMVVFATITPEEAKQQLDSFGSDADFTMVEDMAKRSSAVG